MFVIGKRIEAPKNPTNVYKLVISNMSGDADAYETTKTLIGKEFEPVIEDLIELCELSNSRSAGSYRPNRESIAKMYKEIQDKHPDFFKGEDGIDIDYEPIITWDVTCTDYICRPEFKRLTWFDENGIEYKVEIK